uniref:Uncharacterized protein n=1 Tax=Chromera velia CCMP2878 TaxID=1169474 RepID=A0A0G4FC27_9ALVE|eukprot:Cvel_16282.t1-p1 / transcript=Cvel_16282.t1 / gene=Cvel_16282 / organism=Chromera_velia_CCMP2878 / gene_product=hypothetical protein / transcript_product=hypothetical protein / location=Cvel_scaffold1247:432-9737(-) / protein_length=239 / sequence_SO=supercontig / SO=protein_coding / is_pseudo=false
MDKDSVYLSGGKIKKERHQGSPHKAHQRHRDQLGRALDQMMIEAVVSVLVDGDLRTPTEVICGVNPVFDVTDERMRALLTTNYNPEEEVTSEKEGAEGGGGKKRKLKKRQPRNDAKRRKAVERLLKMEAIQFRTAMEHPCVVRLRGKAIQGVLPGLQVDAVFNRWFGVEGGVARRLLRPSIYMSFSSSRWGSASLYLVYDVPDNPAAMERVTFVASSFSSATLALAAAAAAGAGILQVA